MLHVDTKALQYKQMHCTLALTTVSRMSGAQGSAIDPVRAHSYANRAYANRAYANRAYANRAYANRAYALVGVGRARGSRDVIPVPLP